MPRARNKLFTSWATKQTRHTTKMTWAKIQYFQSIGEWIYSYLTILVFPVPHMPVINRLWPSIAFLKENSRLSHILQFWRLANSWLTKCGKETGSGRYWVIFRGDKQTSFAYIQCGPHSIRTSGYGVVENLESCLYDKIRL